MNRHAHTRYAVRCPAIHARAHRDTPAQIHTCTHTHAGPTMITNAQPLGHTPEYHATRSRIQCLYATKTATVLYCWTISWHQRRSAHSATSQAFRIQRADYRTPTAPGDTPRAVAALIAIAQDNDTTRNKSNTRKVWRARLAGFGDNSRTGSPKPHNGHEGGGQARAAGRRPGGSHQ
jgi:hypothetical protein